MRKMLPILVIVVVLLALATPVLAETDITETGTASVNVQLTQGTTEIWVKAKWEALDIYGGTSIPEYCKCPCLSQVDLLNSEPDKVTCFESCSDKFKRELGYVPLYVDPPYKCGQTIPIYYFAVVHTSSRSSDWIRDVYAKINMAPDCAYKKIQLYSRPLIAKPDYTGNFVRDGGEACEMLKDAYDNGLVTFAVNPKTGVEYTKYEVCTELLEQQAFLYYTVLNLDPCKSSAGWYDVCVGASDWSFVDSSAFQDPLCNKFFWAPNLENTCYFDFTGIDYGNVVPGTHAWMLADYDLTTPLLPTVKNCGNVPMKMKVKESDMCMGAICLGKISGEPDDIFGSWNVKYDFRVVPKKEVPQDWPVTYYSPEEWAYSRTIIERCDVDKVDFSIKLREVEFPGVYTAELKRTCKPCDARNLPKYCIVEDCEWTECANDYSCPNEG